MVLTAKSSLTISDFLINQNDISDLERELIGLLGCVRSDDLHLSQRWGRSEPGSVTPVQGRGLYHTTIYLKMPT